MRSSGEVALFEKKQEVMDAANKLGISSVCLHKPITQAWGVHSRLLCLLVSFDNEFLDLEQATYSINMFRKKATQILGMPFGILSGEVMKERIMAQSSNEAKQEMQERLDYSISLPDLTDEPWLTQFENKKAACLEKSPSYNASIISNDIGSPVEKAELADAKVDSPEASSRSRKEYNRLDEDNSSPELSSNPYSSFSKNSRKRCRSRVNLNDNKNPMGHKSLKG